MSRSKNLTNYHSHSLYCDGRASMEDFVRFALSEGFTSYGFSSHAPLPFSTAWTMEWDRMNDYQAEFHRIKEKYAGKIELYLGLEIDYLNELKEKFENTGGKFYYVELKADLETRLEHNLTPHRLEQKPSKRDTEWTCCIMNGAKWWMWMFRPMFSGR